jgi:hypothetical protein
MTDSSSGSSSDSSGGPPKSKLTSEPTSGPTSEPTSELTSKFKSPFKFKGDTDSSSPLVSKFKADEPTKKTSEQSPGQKLLEERIQRHSSNVETQNSQGALSSEAPRADRTRRTQITNLEITKWSFAVLVTASLIAAISLVLAARLPAPRLRPALHDEPLQTALAPEAATPFNENLHQHVYSVTPRFTYHLTGMVVALSDAMGWKNITHKYAGDFLNTNDICMIWGANAETLDLSKFEFTHGDWTCYVQTHDSAAWSQFKMDGLANNHVLPATPEIAAQFRKLRIGDQIAIDGRLVDYSIDGRPPRTTSIVRTDTGNGACEIIYVTGFSFIARHHAWLYDLGHFATLIAMASFLLLLFSIFALPFLRREDASTDNTGE